MVISYAITTHNEHEELSKLLPFILQWKDLEDEIVIVDDNSGPETWEVFDNFIHEDKNNIKFSQRTFCGDFSKHKNYLISQCSGDWIFNIDADEMPHQILIRSLKMLIEANPTVELFWIPRWNTVEGITEGHASKGGWKLDDQDRVNWPDPQQRLFKNAGRIKWQNRVHERLTGPTHDTILPLEERFCMYHHKTIDKQEQQNEKYANILSPYQS